MKIKDAKQITSGDISTKNSKILGTSFGLSPWMCKKGSELAKIKGSVCHQCYAKRGSGIYPNVKKGRTNNTIAIIDQTKIDGLKKWASAMTVLINSRCKIGFHRWHDAGDLQSLEHYQAIIKIAENLPHIRFWLPTKESNIIKNHKGSIPDNLCIRLSGSMIDGLPPKVKKGLNTSTVHKNMGAHGFVCPAPAQNNSCGECTACYSKNVLNVSYYKH